MLRPFSLAALIAVVGSLANPAGAADKGTRLLRDPDISKNHVVFVHANDLWLVGRNGGDAFRDAPS